MQSLRNLESATKQSSSVFVANVPSSSSPSSQQKKFKPQQDTKPCPTCDFCKKLGHTEDRCFLKEHLQGQLKVEANSASASSASGLLSSPLNTPAYTLCGHRSILSYDTPLSLVEELQALSHRSKVSRWVQYLFRRCGHCDAPSLMTLASSGQHTS